MNQKSNQKIGMAALLAICLFISACQSKSAETEGEAVQNVVSDGAIYTLPAPQTDGTVSLEKTLAERRSRRDFREKALSAAQLSQMLWAAYGVTAPNEDARLKGGFRTAPSAGARYPFEIYAIVGKVVGIDAGVYRYLPDKHQIVQIIAGDKRAELCAAAFRQEMIEKAPVSIFYSAIYSRTTERYGDRGRDRYVGMDLGHSAQNVYLQAEALHLGSCAIGAFSDEEVAEVLQLSEEETPLYIMPIGYYYNK